MVFAESGGAISIYCGHMEVQDDSYGTHSSGGLVTFELDAIQPNTHIQRGDRTGVARHSRLTLNREMDAICFGSAGVPEDV